MVGEDLVPGRKFPVWWIRSDSREDARVAAVPQVADGSPGPWSQPRSPELIQGGHTAHREPACLAPDTAIECEINGVMVQILPRGNNLRTLIIKNTVATAFKARPGFFLIL